MHSKSMRTEFSLRINSLLKDKNLTQRELAERADIKKRALDMYMGVQRSMPPADVACRIARVLGTSVEWLVYGSEQELEKKVLGL